MPDGFVDMDTGKGRHEFICGVHWRLIPRSWKRRRRKIHRWVKRTWPDGLTWFELDDLQRQKHQSAMGASKRIWARMKAQAESPLSSLESGMSLEDVERAFGVA